MEKKMEEITEMCIAKIRPDKILSVPGLRSLLLPYEDKEVRYYPEEIIRDNMDGKFIFFVPVLNESFVKSGKTGEKMTVPLFLLEFTEDQIKELKRIVRKKFGVPLSSFYLEKKSDHLSHSARELVTSADFDPNAQEDENRRLDNLVKSVRPKKLIKKSVLDEIRDAILNKEEDYTFEDLRLKTGGFNRFF